MIALSLKKDVQGILGNSTDDAFCLGKLSEAAEMLSNEGNWDAAIGYMDIQTNGATEYMLPSTIETPIRAYADIDIGPSRGIFRDRLYDYTVNHPSEQLRNQIGWEWSDRGDYPFSIMPTTDTKLRVHVGAAGARVKVTGYDDQGNFLQAISLSEDYTNTPTWAAGKFVCVSREAGVPNTFCQVHAETAGTGYLADGIIASYAWDELEPKYRKITFNKPTQAVHIIFRRATRELQCWSAYIPLNNKLALTQCLRGIRLLQQADPKVEAGQAMINIGIALANKEHSSRNAAQALADAGQQMAAAANANLNLSGMISVSEVYDKAAEVFGPVGKEKLLDEISQSVKRLGTEANWDSLEGFADVRALPAMANCDDTYRCGLVLAFPGWVEGIRAISAHNGMPLIGRSEYIHYHLNGPGRRAVDRDFFDWLPDSPLFRDLETPANLLFIQDEDSEVQIWQVYGRDEQGRQIRASDQSQGIPNTTQPDTITNIDIDQSAQEYDPAFAFKTVDRIIRVSGKGGCRVYVLDLTVTGVPGYQLLAVIDPEDNEAMFRRLRVPVQRGFTPGGIATGGTFDDPVPHPDDPLPIAPCFRVAFTRRNLRYKKLSDPIFLRDSDAIVQAMLSRKTGDVGAMDMAKSILNKEMRNRTSGQPVQVQYLDPVINTFGYDNY